MSLLDAGGNCLPTDWNSADDQKNLILLPVTGLYTTAFWQHILSWHTRRRKNSCLCSLHERSRVPSPSALLLKHYLTAEDFKVIFFSPPVELQVTLHIHLLFPSSWSWKTHWFSTCGPMRLIQYSYGDPSQQHTVNCRGALMDTGLLVFGSLSSTLAVTSLSCQSCNWMEI